MKKIQWEGDGNEWWINPRLPILEEKRLVEGLKSVLSSFKGHLFLLTSGSSSRNKWVALKKEGFLIAAASANQHLEISQSSRDHWLNPLPLFHVGGLAIWARSFLSQSPVTVGVFEKWNASAFEKALFESEATLTSLVPTQLYDLVSQSKSPSPFLRAVLIGGGALSESLYDQAKSLGWPLLPTYGMTELGSQMATMAIGSEEFRELKPLNHVEMKLCDNEICVKGPSLMTGYLFVEEKEVRFDEARDPEGFFHTQDQGEWIGSNLKITGRLSEQIKILGEKVQLGILQEKLEKLALQLKFGEDFALVACPHPRVGHELYFMTTSQDKSKRERLIFSFNEDVLPFERIQDDFVIHKIPRTPLGKIVREECLKEILMRRKK